MVHAVTARNPNISAPFPVFSVYIFPPYHCQYDCHVPCNINASIARNIPPDYDVTYPTAHIPRMRSSFHTAHRTVNVNKVEVRFKYNTNSVPKAHYHEVSITKTKPLMAFREIIAVTTIHISCVTQKNTFREKFKVIRVKADGTEVI